MSQAIKFENLRDRIIELRGQMVLLDADVAELYGVETKRINEAAKNNPEKFPDDYIFAISENEFMALRSKISTAKFAKTRALPKAFTEKGLYMLATILKSQKAVGGEECFTRRREEREGKMFRVSCLASPSTSSG